MLWLYSSNAHENKCKVAAGPDVEKFKKWKDFSRVEVVWQGEASEK